MEKLVEIKDLEKKAYELREIALTMIYEAQSGHPGGSFSIADILTVLYYNEMNIKPENPKWENRDRFVLSKGHNCPILYSVLGDLGFFDKSHLHTLRQENSILQGHPCMKKCPGIDISTGSLGQGLSTAVGMALAGKRDNLDYRVFAAIGDGETNEGQIWEALMCAHKYKLSNLIVIFDNNGLQIDGTTDEIMPLLDMSAKAKAFGYEVYDIDGHNVEEIVSTLEKIKNSTSDLPKFINAKTIKGKGVDYMENQCGWHGTAPNKEQYEDAVRQLRGAK